MFAGFLLTGACPAEFLAQLFYCTSHMAWAENRWFFTS